MAAKTDQVIILPLDTGNTGKKVRSKESVVGANTVQEYFFIPSSERDKVGNYKFSIPATAIPTAAQNGTTTGACWLTNPLGSTIKVAVDRITLKHNFSTTLAVDLIAPLIRINRISFTGTLAAATTTPARRDSTDPAHQALLSILPTGLTVTDVATIYEWIGQTQDVAASAGGHWSAQNDEWNPSGEGDELILRPGEGIVIFSQLAVTTANRKLIINGAWNEFN